MDSQFGYGSGAVRSGVHTSARSAFIARTYNHLFGAIITFTLLEIFYFTSGMAATMARAMLGTNWLFVLGGFVLVSWLASRAAYTARTTGAQYLALFAFVVAESLIFVPLLYVANAYAPGAIRSAATVTLAGFAGLTFIAFRTRKDFTFLGGLLRWAGVLALLAIVGGVIFGFQLGTWFSVGMVGLAGGAILHDTSRIMRDFPEDRHVAAALQLFASVALMFWYVLRLFMGSRR
jgi:FtsH-binding integral membrane protein